MNMIYQGKTKDIFQLEDGNYLLQFKDDATGANGVFDPGANTVGLKIEGAGLAGLKLTKYFFEILHQQGVPTHYVDVDLTKATMIVKPAILLGKGLEVICRYRAVGSFYRRYGLYVEEGQPLDGFVEITLKDDDRQDPPITDDALEMLGILSKADYLKIKELTLIIAATIQAELAKKDIELYDIKFEFGRVGKNQEIVLIDEISGGNMRAFHQGKQVPPVELARLILEG